jgi:SAM-dependent methyltransferase
VSHQGVPGGRERVEREQQEAHHRYHEVFAALDRVVNDAAAHAAPGDAAAERLAAFQSVLVQFLQQITPYVDTKVRIIEQQVADIAMTATVAQRAAIGAQRAVEVGRPADTGRAASGPAEAGRPAAPPRSVPDASGTDAAYVGFEDCFRGSEDEIRARQADYVALFSGAGDVLDVGCGRGEFLSLLREAGISARGIDMNEEMVQACRSRGLSAERADAVNYLAELRGESLGGLFAAQVVEHLEPKRLTALVREAGRVLRPGARLVLETINPTCWVAFFESYLRDLTHVQPLHPDTLKFLVVAGGFTDVHVQFRMPIPERDRLRRLPPLPDPGPTASPDARVLAGLVSAFNLNMERLNDRMFTHLDYAVIGARG